MPRGVVHLADGFVIDYGIECLKHSGAVDNRKGRTASLLASNLTTYKARVDDDWVLTQAT